MALQKKNFSDIITFTRTSEGGRFNASGNYEVVPQNMPRLDYDPITKMARGLLCEESRTNLLINSNDLGTGWNANGSSTIERGITPSPDGLMNGARLYGTSEFYIFQVVPITGQPTITISLYAKRVKPGDAIRLRLFEGGGSQPNEVQTSANITLTDAWTRYELTATLKQTDRTSVQLVILGNVTANGSEAYVWGTQMEVGSFATSLIKTGASQVTRTTDSVKVNTLSPWYNQKEGTLFCEYTWGTSPVASGNRSLELAVSSDANNSALRIYEYNDGGRAVLSAGAGTGGDTILRFLPTSQNLQNHKVALAYTPTQIAASRDGSDVLSSAHTKLPVFDVMVIGARASSGQILSGHVRAIRYYPRRLTDSEIKALTS